MFKDRKHVILDRIGQEPYLVRYYLFIKDRKWFPFNVFLHKFLQSDPDELHDCETLGPPSMRIGTHAWSLFVPGPKLREWGFIVNDKWMHNEKYFEWRKQKVRDEKIISI